MNSEQLIEHARRLGKLLYQEKGPLEDLGPYTQACEFLRTYAGTKSSFYAQAARVNLTTSEYRNRTTAQILESFAQYVETGLSGEITPERKAQLDIVSDLLDQANTILEDKKLHPGAAAVLIGATLEEFLRTWVEKEGLSMGTKKRSIDAYTKTLREADLISKQDVKDLTAWAGIRNDSAHGNWEGVSSRDKISIMLQGVNLFMRKYETS